MNDFGFDGPRRPLVWRILLSPFTLLKQLFGGLGANDELAGPRGLGGWLKLIFVSPFVWLFTNSGRLLINWSSSRQAMSFLLGVPAFLFALLVLSVYAYGRLAPGGMVDAYKFQMQRAKAAEDFETAEVYLNKLMRIDDEDPNALRMQKVELLMKQSKFGDAYRLLLEMTNPDNPESVGNSAANSQLARFYLSEAFRELNGFQELTTAQKRQFILDVDERTKEQFEYCLAQSPTRQESAAAHAFLYNYHVKRKQVDEAEPHIRELHQLSPLGYAVPHYAFYTTLKPTPAIADPVAKADSDRLYALLTKNEGTRRNKDIWKLIFQLQTGRREFELGLKQLEAALAKDTKEATVLEQVRSAILTVWASDLRNKEPVASRGKQLELLSRALRRVPSMEAVQQLVLLGFPLDDSDDQWIYDAKATAEPGSPVFFGANLLLGLRESFEGNDEAAKTYLDLAEGLSPTMPVIMGRLRSTMEESVVNQPSAESLPASGGLYMILGGHSVAKKDYQRGVKFFRKALEVSPETPAAMNNLAVCLSLMEGSDEDDLAEALELVNRATELLPNTPNYYETRGAIYLQMGKYNESIADLEKCLALKYADEPAVWKKLVKACRGAGREKEAAAYERALESVGQSADEEGAASEAVGSDSETNDASDDAKTDSSDVSGEGNSEKQAA